MRHGSRRGITIIEVLVVLTLIGILAAIAFPRFDHARARAMAAVLMADLDRLELAQEQFVTNGRPSYSTDFRELGFLPSEHVNLVITQATDRGWAAFATHRQDSQVRCGVFHHLHLAPMAWPAGAAGAVECARGRVRFVPDRARPRGAIIR